MRARRAARVALAAPLVLAALTIACDAPAPDPGIATAATAAPRPSATAAPEDPVAAMRRWAQCMRDQGVDMPDPDPAEGKIVGFEYPGKGTPEAERIAGAERACQRYDTFSAATEPMSAEELAAWRTYAQCMRDQGVEISDPDPAGWPPLPSKQSIRSGLADRAMAACRGELDAARHARGTA